MCSMSNVNNGTKKERSKVFEMVLSGPGMEQSCKLAIKTSRRNALILARLIETGLLADKELLEDDLLASLSQEVKKEFQGVHTELLDKTGLTEFYDKLKAL